MNVIRPPYSETMAKQSINVKFSRNEAYQKRGRNYLLSFLQYIYLTMMAKATFSPRSHIRQAILCTPCRLLVIDVNHQMGCLPKKFLDSGFSFLEFTLLPDTRIEEESSSKTHTRSPTNKMLSSAFLEE